MEDTMQFLTRITLRTLLAVASIALLMPSYANAEDFYAGKTITVIVGVSAGSGGDVSARTFMAGLTEKIPGNPKIIVRNMEGAGGAVALNYTYEKADPDGLTFYYGNWDPMAVLAGGEGIRFVPENFGAIGSAANERGTIVRMDAAEGMTQPSDIAKVEGLRVGGRSSSNTNDLIGNLALSVIDVNFRYIPGFKSMKKMAPGILSGELQAGHTATGGFSRFFTDTTKDGETMMMFYHPFFNQNGDIIVPATSPFYPKLPSLRDLHLQIHGTEPSGVKWETYKWLRTNVHSTSPAMVAPPGTPDNLLDVLRSAYQSTWSDEEFQARWLAQFGDPPHVNSTGSTIAAFQNYRSITPDMLAVVEEMVALGR